LKRKEKAQVWLEKINEYRESGKSLVQWCTDTGVAIHNMNYWLRKQAPITKVADKETSWVSCIVEGPESDAITLKMKNVEIEVTSGFQEELLLQIIRTLDRL